MGQMKWVQSIIDSNQEQEFKLAYQTALFKNLTTFMFDNVHVDLAKAEAVIKIINQHNKHIENMADEEMAQKVYWIEVENKLNS